MQDTILIIAITSLLINIVTLSILYKTFKKKA